MELNKVKEALEQQLNERREVIRDIRLGFPREVAENYKDAHTPIEPFRGNWGRGVLFKKGDDFFAKVGSYSTSHANLKSGAGMNVEKTFYYGLVDGTLYIQPASLGGGDYSRPMIIEIAAATAEEGPLKGSVFRLGKR